AVDLRNAADQMVFQTEKTLGEIGDKISGAEKAEVEAKLEELKEALKGTDIELIKAKQDELQKAFYALSEKLYQAQAAAQGAGPDLGGMGGMGADPMGGQNGDPNVVDADFTEVDN
ncbi:MAG: Hsp70 family protein, partial [Oscillospiraceae bacterium]|nr:Hsp70 family protein [Oscillospiraceae bacterium]